MKSKKGMALKDFDLIILILRKMIISEEQRNRPKWPTSQKKSK